MTAVFGRVRSSRFRTFALAAAWAAAVLPVSAGTVFFDEFNRGDSAEPGDGWSSWSGSWEIARNRLRPAPGDLTLEKVAVHPEELAAPLLVEAEIRWTVRNQWNGIVWNARDASTFYVLRSRVDTGSVQIIRRTDGENARIIHNAPGGTIAVEDRSAARFVVHGDGAGNFVWEIRNGETRMAGDRFFDTGVSGGAAGVYAGREGMEVESFRISTFRPAVSAETGVAPAVEIFFNGERGWNYRIQSSDDLIEWRSESELVSGMDGEIARMFSIRGRDRGYYRVAVSRGPIIPVSGRQVIVPPVRTEGPRLMFTPESFARMKTRVTLGLEPWASAAANLVEEAERKLDAVAQPYTGRDSLAFYQAAVIDGERARLLAYAWLVSDEERFAAAALETLLAWASADPVPASNFDPAIRFPNTGMEVARAAVPMLEVYDLARDHPALSNSDREVIEEWFSLLTLPILTGKRRWEENDYFNRQDFQNHLTAHVMGLAAIGYTLGDRDLVQFALDHPENPRDFKELIAGTILMAGDVPHHREPAYANPPMDGEIYDRYRHFTAGGRGITYVHLSLSQLLYTAEIAWNNGIDFYRYIAPGGENLRLPLQRYADLFRTRDLREVGGFFAAENHPARADEEQQTLDSRRDFPLIYEIGNVRYPGTTEIERLLESVDRVAVPRHSHSSFFYPVLTHGAAEPR